MILTMLMMIAMRSVREDLTKKEKCNQFSAELIFFGQKKDPEVVVDFIGEEHCLLRFDLRLFNKKYLSPVSLSPP